MHNTNKKLIARITAAGALALTALTACTTVLDPSREDLIPLDQGQITQTQTQTLLIPSADRTDPLVLTGLNANGEEISTSDFLGQPVVINAWASWCAPCIEEAPILTEQAQKNPNVAFLGLRVMDGTQEPPPPLQGLAKNSITDTNGKLLTTIPNVPPRALPSTTVLDAQGRIAAQHIGPITTEIMEKMLQQARS